MIHDDVCVYVLVCFSMYVPTVRTVARLAVAAVVPLITAAAANIAGAANPPVNAKTAPAPIDAAPILA